MEAEDTKPAPFEKKCKLSNGYLGNQLKRASDMGETAIVNIIIYNPKMNPVWLVLGIGEMYNDENYKYDDEIIEDVISKLGEATNLVHILKKSKKAAE